ncbi:hypothetical protein ABT214_29200, partial [Micromonospora purpureochromogenes]
MTAPTPDPPTSRGPGAPAGDGFLPGADRTAAPAPDDLALPVSGRRVLTRADGRFARVGELPADTDWIPVGTLDGVPAWATDVAEAAEAWGRWRSWRSLAAQ